MTYHVRFTALAAAFLGTSRAPFEERARGELAEFPKNPLKVVIYCIEYEGRWFGCVGKGDHVLVDTITFKEMPPLTSGPFKGKRPMIPICDTEGAGGIQEC